MIKKFRLTLLEIIVIIIISLFVLSLIMPLLQITSDHEYGYRAKYKAKDLGLMLFAYAEEDIRSFKLPYPLPRGKEKVWGNSKDCWSTSIVEMLLAQRYIKKENNEFSYSEYKSIDYKPMMLNDSTVNQDKYWDKNTILDFHIYCEKSLTSNFKDKIVLIATYDNDDIRNCQFNGKGWVVFYSNKTVEFVKRKKFKDFDPMTTTIKEFSINTVEGSITGPGIVLRKDIPESEGGPGTFGNKLGGGSTELMGKRDTDAVYKALVK